jgi:hypothetical protein
VISVTVDVPASTLIEYKYIRKNNGAVTWESDPNNRFSSPANGTFGELQRHWYSVSDFLVALNDTWR